MRRRSASGGFSLVEVLIALGLLGGVLISIGTLFIIGAKQVKAGRTSSEALAVAREIQEDLVGWGYAQLWRTFGQDGRATIYTIDTRTSAACGAWQATLAEKLGPEAFADITFESLSTVGGAATSLADGSGNAQAKAIRVTVTVNWMELPERRRSVTLGTTRN